MSVISLADTVLPTTGHLAYSRALPYPPDSNVVEVQALNTEIGGGKPRRVLVVEPVFHVHSIVYWDACLRSIGFEDAQIVIACCISEQHQRDRALAWAAHHPRAELRLLEGEHLTLSNRIANWAAHHQSMVQVEAMLRNESFELVVYMMVDCVFPFLSLRVFRGKFRAHWAARISGLVFRDNGLREASPPTWKARLRAGFDRFMLGRATRSPAVRRLAFLDPWCAERARELFKSDLCIAGVDPIELRDPIPASNVARTRLGVPDDAFAVLLFGSFSERKGIVQMLEILRDTKLHRPLCIILGGPVAPEIRARFDVALAAVKKQHTVLWHDGFVPDESLPDYFAAPDVVLCAYKDFTGSSGILLHAAAFGKPALVSPGGVMADAVTRHGCGEVVDLGQPSTFIAALSRIAGLSEAERIALSECALGYARVNDARRYLSQFV